MRGFLFRVKEFFLSLFSLKSKGFLKLVFPIIFLGIIFAWPAQATSTLTVTILDSVLSLLAAVINQIAQTAGQLVVLLIGRVIIPLLQYNDFANSPAVGIGWAVIRDAVNMFFVLILIAIAFGTILGGLNRFKWQQQVPRLLFVAIFINFSRLFCGLMIDFSQVFMMTFVSAIKDIAGGNFIQMFGLQKIMEVSTDSQVYKDIQNSGGTTPFSLFAGAMISLLLMLVVLITLIFLTLILAFRIVTLWILVTIAPLAWFFKSLKDIYKPKNDPYASWWAQFICCLQLGPILVFFLWLALAVAGSGTVASSFPSSSSTETFSILSMMDGTSLVSFIVSIALLFAGFKAADDACESGGLSGVMKGLTGTSNKMSRGLVGAPVTVPMWGAKKGYKIGKWGVKKGGKLAWGGMSGQGGIKGAVLGSKALSNFGEKLAQSPIRGIGGAFISSVINKQRVATTGAKAKYDSERINNIVKAGEFNDKNETELTALLGSGDKFTRLAAVQAMSNKGLFKDEKGLPAAQRQARIDNINKARKEMEDNPEAREAFDDKIRKQSPGLALDTIYTRAKAGGGTEIDTAKLESDMVNLKIGAGAVLSSTNSGNVPAIKDMLGGGPGSTANDRVEKLFNLFKGNEKEMTSAIGGINVPGVKETLFDGLDAKALAEFTQVAEIDPVTGAKTGKTVADYNARKAIVSSLVSNGISVGNSREIYKNQGIAGENYNQVDADKAYAKHVDQSAGSYNDLLVDMLDSGKRSQAEDLLAGIYEVGDRVLGKTVEELRKGKVKNIADTELNDSLVAKGISFETASPADQAEAKIKLENAIEKAIKGGAAINLSNLTSSLNATTKTVIEDKISDSSVEDLNKMRFDKGRATVDEIGKLIFDQVDTASLIKVFESGANRALMNAVKDYANSIPRTTGKHTALSGFLS